MPCAIFESPKRVVVGRQPLRKRVFDVALWAGHLVRRLAQARSCVSCDAAAAWWNGLEVWPDMIHAWHVLYRQVAAGRHAAAVGAFIRSVPG
jgi:hypothetical protein